MFIHVFNQSRENDKFEFDGLCFKNRKLDIVGVTIDNKLTLDNHTGLKVM